MKFTQTYILASLLVINACYVQSHQVGLKLEITGSQRSKGSVKKPIEIHLDISDATVNVHEIQEKVQTLLRQKMNDRCDVTTTTSIDAISTNGVATATSKGVTTPSDVTTTVSNTATERFIAQTVHMDNGYTYHLLKEGNYSQGKEYCKQLSGALAVLAVNNYTVMEEITNQVRIQNKAEQDQSWSIQAFVGFTDSETDGYFKADDGTSIKEPEGRTPWNVHEPNILDKEKCVEVILNNAFSPRLNNLECSRAKFGLCETNSALQGVGYWAAGFKYFRTQNRTNYEGVLSQCKEANAWLAVRAVNNFTIMQEIREKMEGDRLLYVDFKLEDKVFVSENGTKLMETKGGTQWYNAGVTNEENATDCVSVMLYKNAKLRLSSCDRLAYALCEVPMQ